MFQQPIFQSNVVDKDERLPSMPVILGMLAKLKAAGILKVLREVGLRAQVLSLVELVNL